MFKLGHAKVHTMYYVVYRICAHSVSEALVTSLSRVEISVENWNRSYYWNLIKLELDFCEITSLKFWENFNNFVFPENLKVLFNGVRSYMNFGEQYWSQFEGRSQKFQNEQFESVISKPHLMQNLSVPF